MTINLFNGARLKKGTLFKRAKHLQFAYYAYYAVYGRSMFIHVLYMLHVRYARLAQRTVQPGQSCASKLKRTESNQDEGRTKTGSDTSTEGTEWFRHVFRSNHGRLGQSFQAMHNQKLTSFRGPKTPCNGTPLPDSRFKHPGAFL